MTRTAVERLNRGLDLDAVTVPSWSMLTLTATGSRDTVLTLGLALPMHVYPAGWPDAGYDDRGNSMDDMSVKVDLDKLADALTDYTFAYVITVSDDHRAHTVAVEPVFADGFFDVGPIGGTTGRNLETHNTVTLVWPPAERGGFTLIVDGRADGSQIIPDRAVLHRKAQPGGSTKPGCKDDCHPL